MFEPDHARRAPKSYFALVRTHAVDLAATAFLFVCVSIAAGRIWRYPFDDEIFTLVRIEPAAVRAQIVAFPATDDLHPPLSHLIFYGLREIGLSEAGMRLCSVAMTALALLLCQVLVLTWIARRDVAAPSLPTRLFSVFIFGLTPLAISQGGALRWYPVFALLIILFVVLYLAPRQNRSDCGQP
jgi:hypothetical protein